ncbi:hypothetical protein ABPG74_000777 [Tetrahymena malaccensis]
MQKQQLNTGANIVQSMIIFTNALVYFEMSLNLQNINLQASTGIKLCHLCSTGAAKQAPYIIDLRALQQLYVSLFSMYFQATKSPAEYVSVVVIILVLKGLVSSCLLKNLKNLISQYISIYLFV